MEPQFCPYEHTLSGELQWLAFIALVVAVVLSMTRTDGKWRGLG